MKSFEEIRAQYKDYTAVDDNRLRLIHSLVKQTKNVDGIMAEIGVYKGGSSFLIANTDPSRLLYSCDSFEGLPETSQYDTFHSKGDFSDTSFDKVKQLLAPFNTKVIKGFFPNANLHEEMYKKQYSFVHVDVDLYQPTLDCLTFFYDRMTKGAILVSDDYKMPSCPGVKQAFDEFMKDKKETLIDSGHYSCYFIKE